jgi:hypothetical protein
MADSIAFTSVSEPAMCGSVCVPAISQTNNGNVSGGILSSITSLDQVEYAEARINLATGAAGVVVANDHNGGSSSASASHFDTWFCPDPIACAALATPGSFVPVNIDLHVSGSASLTPGEMDLSYSYDVSSLLGSSALGSFRFEFFEDPGLGLDADVEGTATFQDNRTEVEYNPTVIVTSQGFNSGFIAFSANLTVTTYIGGCTAAGCDLSHGIFTDLQSVSARVEGVDSAQILDSSNTFQVSIVSDLPFISADGRTTGAAVAAPEPSSLSLVLVAAIMALARTAYVRGALFREESTDPVCNGA